MATINSMTIKSFIDPMKRINKSYIKIDNLIIDLDNLYIKYGKQTIYLSKQMCNYGGARYYFVCPECCKLSYKLFSKEGVNAWKCNRCIGLKSRTLNRTKTDCTYYWGLAVKEAKKVDPTYTQDDYMPNSFKFPSRPKGMSKKKYSKHFIRFNHYYVKGEQLFMSGARNILGR